MRLAAVSAAMPVASEAERVVLSGILVRLALRPRERTKTGNWIEAVWHRLMGLAMQAVDERRRADADAACVEIARCWGSLPTLARAAAIEACRGRWGPAVRGAAADPAAGVRAGAAELVRAVGEPALLAEVRPLLADTEEGVAAAAEAAFVAAAGSGNRAGRAEVEKQVAGTLEEFDRHRRRGLLGAVVALADGAFLARMAAGNGGRLAEMLGDETQAFQMALRSFVRKSEERAVRGRAWEWLGRGIAAAACIERVGRAGNVLDHEAVLTRAHLAGNPRRAARARQVKGEGAAPDAGVVAHLSGGARRGLVRWVEAVEMGAERRAAVMALLVRDGDPGVRLAAMRLAPARAVQGMCADADGRVAAAALRRSSTAGMERRRMVGRSVERPRIVMERLAEQGAPAVRVLAAQELEREDPWDARSAAGRLAARERLGANPAAFLGELRERLLSTEGALGAVMVVRALGLQARFEPELLGLLREPAAVEKVAPTVLAALGESGTQGAKLAVDAHIRDPRERTRANAVEALARQSRAAGRGDRRADVLIELKSDPQHRVRANAIRGLFHRGRVFGEAGMVMEEPAAFDALGAMLSDERPAHRVAAIWVAGRVLPSGSPAGSSYGRRWAELAGRITDLSRSDPDVGARARAARAASRVMAGLREGWTAAAADTGMGLPAGRAA